MAGRSAAATNSLRLHAPDVRILAPLTQRLAVPALRTAPLLVFLLAAAVLPACNRAPDDPNEALADSDTFAVVMGRFPATEDQPPGLDGDSLVIRVRYVGDCEENTWTLVERVEPQTATLALHRNGGDDECEGEVYDELRFGVSQEARQARGLVLLGPDGETFPLR